MYVIHDYILVFNALHARKTGKLSYKDIRVYTNILAKKLSKNNIYWIGSDEYSDTYTTVDNHCYISLGDYCLLKDAIDDEFINELNSIYSEEIQTLINESRDEFANMTLEEEPKHPYVKTKNDNLN